MTESGSVLADALSWGPRVLPALPTAEKEGHPSDRQQGPGQAEHPYKMRLSAQEVR